MKRIIFILLTLALAPVFAQAQGDIYVEGGSHHVQGIAYDQEVGKMYFSFTDSFLVTDMKGNVLGSLEHIQGHLGAMVFDPARRKVFASLECKDDVIGQGLSDFAKGRSMFYIAIIDVDKVSKVGMDSEDNEAFKIVCVREATKDYHLKGFGSAGISMVAPESTGSLSLRSSGRKVERIIYMWLTEYMATLPGATMTARSCCDMTLANWKVSPAE